MKTDLIQSCGHCWVFQICWHIECSTFTASYFRIWNSSAGNTSPPLAFFVVMFPTGSSYGCFSSGSWWWTRNPGMLQSVRSQRVGHDWETEMNWCFLRPTWIHTPECLALGEWSHHCGYPKHKDLFLYSSSVYSCNLFLISSVSVRYMLFLSFIVPVFAWNVPLVSSFLDEIF